MELFIEFFGCGKVYSRTNLSSPRCDFIVQDAPSLLNIIILHFEEFPLQNVKNLDYQDFKSAIYLVRNKDHLTPTGLARIRQLSARINTGRP